MKFTKRLVAVCLLLLATVPMMVADALADFTGSTAINAPFTSVLVEDLKTGQVLASHNERKPLIPASIMKSVTTATLLDKVGPKYRYETPVYATGPVENGVIDGNLLIVASGDPSINTTHNPHTADFVTEIVDALVKAKVTRINGTVVIDESEFPLPAVNPTWSTGDLAQAYGTGTHGFNFEDNAKGKSSVKEPSLVFKTRLRKALADAGIAIGESEIEARGKRKLIVNHQSATIDEIMRSCMMRSDNQFAESMLRLVGLKYDGTGSSAKGAEQQLKFWKSKHADAEGVVIMDGSGLSRTNRLTARFMADMLRSMHRNPYYASFFPLAGQEGTLRSLLAGSPLEGYIAMKTGSMNGIQCYAGYKLDDDYVPTHVVVIMMNEMKDRAAARKQVEKLLLSLFE